MTSNERYKESRNADLEKSRSLDSEYDKYQYNVPTDFDKSRSFDEDYGESNSAKYLDDSRSFSIDQVYSKNKQTPPPRQSSPQNYGSRLYDHELMYDTSRKAMERSPLMDYKRQQKPKNSIRNSRDRSPNINRDSMYRAISRNLDQSQAQQQLMRDNSPSNVSTLLVNHSAIGSSSSPGSDFNTNTVEYDMRGNVMNDELIKEAKLVTEFLYGNKAKAEKYLNQRQRNSKSNRSHHVAEAPATSGRYIRN